MITTSRGASRRADTDTKTKERRVRRSLDQALADARREADAGTLIPAEEANRIIDAMPTEPQRPQRR